MAIILLMILVAIAFAAGWYCKGRFGAKADAIEKAVGG